MNADGSDATPLYRDALPGMSLARDAGDGGGGGGVDI